MKKSYLILPIFVMIAILGVSCATTHLNTTLHSEGKVYRSVQGYRFAIIKRYFDMTDKTRSQLALARQFSTLANQSELRIGDIEAVIRGHMLKNGISTLSAQEFIRLDKNQKRSCLVIEWDISGRNARGKEGAFSQEVTVGIKDAVSQEIVYRGVGEYFGQTQIDDLTGALLAALKNFSMPPDNPDNR